MEKGSIAVIFISRRTGDPEAYGRAAEEMEEAVRAAPGYLGHDSVSSPDGRGITISYWRDSESVAAWRDEARHSAIRAEGRASWYESYRLIVTRIERSHDWLK